MSASLFPARLSQAHLLPAHPFQAAGSRAVRTALDALFGVALDAAPCRRSAPQRLLAKRQDLRQPPFQEVERAFGSGPFSIRFFQSFRASSINASTASNCRRISIASTAGQRLGTPRLRPAQGRARQM